VRAGRLLNLGIQAFYSGPGPCGRLVAAGQQLDRLEAQTVRWALRAHAVTGAPCWPPAAIIQHVAWAAPRCQNGFSWWSN